MRLSEIHDRLRSLYSSDQELILEPERIRVEARSTTLWPNASDFEVLGVVKPKTQEGVQKLVRLADEMQFSLWTISSGRNWGYGSKRPIKSGCVILSFENLSKIIEINEELAYAVIEPGVTYRQLRAHLEKYHPQLWCDCTDGPPEGSVIGNALDRGLGVTSLGDHFGSLCGLDVLLANGDIIRTGGGPKDCHTWNTHKWGVGPYVEGLFTQGNFGIVLRAGVWLLRKPEYFESFVFDLDEPRHLGKMIDQIRELFLAGVLTSFTHIVNDITTLAVLSKFPRRNMNQLQRVSSHVATALKKDLNIPCWSFGGGLHGDQAQVRHIKKKLKNSLRGLGRLEFITDRKVEVLKSIESGLSSKSLFRNLLSHIGFMFLKFFGLTIEKIEAAPHVHSVLKGVPSDYFVRHAYLKSRLPKPEMAHPEHDEVGLIWFAPILPMSGAHVDRVLENNKRLFAEAGFEYYVALLVQNARSLISLHGIFFDPKIKPEVDRAQQLYHQLQKSMQDLGYQEYRVPILGMPRLFENNTSYLAFLNRIKSAVDPRGILSPGKYGIDS